MRTFRSIFYLFLFFPFFLLGKEPLLLKNKMIDAKKGDYLIVSLSQHLTLFHIHSKEANEILIEEITIPQNQILWKKNLLARISR